MLASGRVIPKYKLTPSPASGIDLGTVRGGEAVISSAS